jgi:hypothetical protein
MRHRCRQEQASFQKSESIFPAARRKACHFFVLLSQCGVRAVMGWHLLFQIAGSSGLS